MSDVSGSDREDGRVLQNKLHFSEGSGRLGATILTTAGTTNDRVPETDSRCCTRLTPGGKIVSQCLALILSRARGEIERARKVTARHLVILVRYALLLLQRG